VNSPALKSKRRDDQAPRRQKNGDNKKTEFISLIQDYFIFAYTLPFVHPKTVSRLISPCAKTLTAIRSCSAAHGARGGHGWIFAISVTEGAEMSSVKAERRLAGSTIQRWSLEV